VHSVVAGQRLVTPSLATKLITEFANMGRGPAARPSDAPKLTLRELEVLRYVAEGRKNRDISQTLGISENTVKNHVRNILEKLRLHSRVQAVRYAIDQNLIQA
jgi:two-component system NarL family response regulator